MVLLREKGVSFADAAAAAATRRVYQNVFRSTFRRGGARKLRPRAGVEIFEFGKLKFILVEGRVFDLPDRIVLLAVKLDQQFELLLGEGEFATRKTIALGRKHVTALVRHDVRIVGALE